MGDGSAVEVPAATEVASRDTSEEELPLAHRSPSAKNIPRVPLLPSTLFAVRSLW